MSVDHADLGFIDHALDRAVIVLNLLHLRTGSPVGIYDAVAGEVIVGRSVAEISAVSLVLFSVSVSRDDGLVDIVPDEASLESGFLMHEVRVFVHAAAGIAHGMRVLAHDERLVGMLRKELLNIGHVSVHLALHVGCVGTSAVIEHTLVMDQPVGIELMEKSRHIGYDIATEGFVSVRPDQYGRVVLVYLITAAHPVKEQRFVFHMIRRDGISGILCSCGSAPGAVSFHVVLGDHVQTVLIAQIVYGLIVGIV